jgi:uncharacterized membrane protein
MNNKSNTKNYRRVTSVGVLCIALLGSVCLLTGCADTVGFTDAASREPVGFWYGLWHGLIAPIAWLVSLFYDDVAIYAIYNNGGWYDFGFMLGIGALGSASKR